MLELERVTKRYGERVAVDRVSFALEAGEIVGFLGPNGAGKSTTMRMITGYLEPSGGRVRVGSVDAQREPLRARAQLGYMPEGVPLYGEMRVREYLRFRAELKGVAPREVTRAVGGALERAGVDGFADRVIDRLSKGMRQRVGFADALVADPPILILDEPSSGLDPNQIRTLRSVIREFQGKKTVLLSTHILPEVEATCGRVIIIDQGRVVGEGVPRDLRGAPVVTLVGRGSPAAFEAALQDHPSVESLAMERRAEGVTSVRMRVAGDPEKAAEAFFRSVVEHGLSLIELRPEERSLEDVFAQLTTERREDELPPDGSDEGSGAKGEGAQADDSAGDAANDDSATDDSTTEDAEEPVR